MRETTVALLAVVVVRGVVVETSVVVEVLDVVQIIVGDSTRVLMRGIENRRHLVNPILI